MNSGVITRILVGLFLVLLGIGFMLDQLGLNFLQFNVFNLWPFIFILIALPMLLKKQIIGGLIFLTLGCAFLFANFFGYSIFGMIWPIIIIIVGISIIFRPKRWDNHDDSFSNSSTVEKDWINESVVFWGMDYVVKSDNFEGGKVECVFGGFKLDLRKAKIKDDAALELNAVFGAGELLLPRDVRVQVESTSVMGGVTNSTMSGKTEDPLIRIKASAVCGGVDIKN